MNKVIKQKAIIKYLIINIVLTLLLTLYIAYRIPKQSDYRAPLNIPKKFSKIERKLLEKTYYKILKRSPIMYCSRHVSRVWEKDSIYIVELGINRIPDVYYVGGGAVRYYFDENFNLKKIHGDDFLKPIIVANEENE